MRSCRLDRQARAAGQVAVTKVCAHHGEVEHRLDSQGRIRCPRCNTDAVARRRRVVKQILVDEAGGLCALCGYDRCLAALHFHHLDPRTKAFAVSRQGVTRAIEEARREAKKCVLLCSDCHAEVENGYSAVPEI